MLEQGQEIAMKRFLKVALLLLLGSNSCFALEAKFAQEQACVPASEHISSCEIRPGDSLSKYAIAVYGDWHLYSVIKDANPKITDANKIYAGSRINIPDVAVPTPKVEMAAAKISPMTTVSANVASEEITAPLSMEDDSSALPSMEVFAQASVPVVRLAAQPTQVIETASIATSPSTPANAQSPAPTSVPTGTATENANAKPAKTTGYKRVIPQNVAVAMGGIPLKCPLKTEVLSYASDEAKIKNAPGGYLHLKDSWAQKEGDNIVLYVHDLPSKPFNLFIAGIHDPIDGKTFMAEAETFQGKFPGPNRTGKRIFSSLMLGANGYMLASTLGPIAGSSVMGGMLITREIMKHHAEASLRKAEDKFNASLAGGKTPPSEKRLGQ